MATCPSACRERASRCTELAQRTKDSDLKDVLEMLARSWGDRATQLERAEALRNANPAFFKDAVRPPRGLTGSASRAGGPGG
jgi:hypothetical protein